MFFNQSFLTFIWNDNEFHILKAKRVAKVQKLFNGKWTQNYMKWDEYKHDENRIILFACFLSCYNWANALNLKLGYSLPKQKAIDTY